MRTLALIGLALGVFGCGNSSGGDDMAVDMAVEIPHNFDQINSEILQPSCAAFSVCHSMAGATMAGHLDLSSDPYKALVGVAANNAKAMGEGKLRVKPCDSANSFLLIKLKLTTDGDATTTYGHHMPDTNPNLPPEQIQAISDWIARGALKSESPTVTGTTCMAGAPDMAGGHD
jgi:hypothetical protein